MAGNRYPPIGALSCVYAKRREIAVDFPARASEVEHNGSVHIALRGALRECFADNKNGKPSVVLPESK